MIDESNLDIPSDDLAPGELLSGPNEPLMADKEIDKEEIVDLLWDAKENGSNQLGAGHEELDAEMNDDYSMNEDGNEDPENCDGDIEIPYEEVKHEDEIPTLLSEGKHLESNDSDDKTE